jgi:F-type H+-transporting ATPase subunit delta
MADTINTEGSFDPGREHLGEVYAKALLGATEKAGVSEAVLAELESFIKDVLDKLPQLAQTLFSLRVKHEEKAALLDKAFGGKMNPSLLNFLKVLSRHNRLDVVRHVLHCAQNQLNQLRGRLDVFVTSAAPVNGAQLDQIKARISQMQGKDVILHTKVDPDLLGGIKVRIGDKVYDSSLATQLKRMKEVALDHTEQQIRASLGRFVGTSA